MGPRCFEEPLSSFWGGKKKGKNNPIGYSLHSKEHYQNIFQLRHENRKQRKNSAPTSEETWGEFTEHKRVFSEDIIIPFCCGFFFVFFFGELIFSKGCFEMINYPKSARKRQKQKGFL